MISYLLNWIEAFLGLNVPSLHQTVETIQGLSTDFCRYSPIAYKYCLLRTDIDQSLYYTFDKMNEQKLSTTIQIDWQFAASNYSVTPVLQISTLNPENVSSPFAISGG